jgi:hypothetical protein
LFVPLYILPIVIRHVFPLQFKKAFKAFSSLNLWLNFS